MTADLQDLFDKAGRNPPTPGLDADAVLRRARRARNRRITGAVVVTVAVALALVAGLAGQRLLNADPVPTAPAPGTLARLAYGIDGDIYVADGDGSSRVVIADGARSEPGHCGGYWGEGPLWSPDGRYLAYRGDGGEATSGTCDRTVQISDATGHRLASFPGEGWAVAWSPDSTRVAVWEDFYGAAKLQIYGLDGVRQALLPMPAGWTASGDFDPVWSPDGASILVPAGAGIPGAEIPVDGSTPRMLPADDPRSQRLPTYSPDGVDIAYVAPDGLTVAAADGSGARLLVRGRVQEFSLYPHGFAWSPTGDRIAFVSVDRSKRADSGPATELSVVDVAGGPVVTLAEMGGADSFKNVRFSPEGEQILFTRTDTTGASSLWSIRKDGSDLARLVAGTGWGDWQSVIRSEDPS